MQRSPLFGDAGGTSFDDPVDTRTELTGVTVRHGYWIDAVQARVGAVDLAVHGGSAGISNGFTLDPGEYLVAIHGRQGANPVARPSRRSASSPTRATTRSPRIRC